MQRATASRTSGPPSCRSPSAESPPSKRQKTSRSSELTCKSILNQQQNEAELDDYGDKRERAVERLIEETGETTWVLTNVDGKSDKEASGIHLATASYAEIDRDAFDQITEGRRSFGKLECVTEVGCPDVLRC